MKDLGVAKKNLGMEIHKDRKAKKLYLSQKKYIEKVLEHFGMKNSKLVSTPLGTHFRLLAALAPQGVGEEPRVPYSNAVGSIMYARVCTSPDIFTGSQCCQSLYGQSWQGSLAGCEMDILLFTGNYIPWFSL
jgi:hypothetical protein